MVPSSGPPPGPSRPKSSSSVSPPKSSPTHIFSPAPTQPRTSWFQLIAPSPSPIPLLPPAVAASLTPLPVQPHANKAPPMSSSLKSYINNDNLIVNLSNNSTPTASTADLWTRAHLRVCAHASANCSACSIALTCCSCRALRFTPGPPPASPVPPIHRSRSASLALFRNVGNGSPPPGFDDCNDYPPPDDDAYAKALAECDTCDNSSCSRGPDEPATYTITVEQFDEGSEELYDCTFRACDACNRSCKRSFLRHCIKSRTFDDSTREALTLPIEPRPPTPLEVFSAVACKHHIACGHVFTTCSACSRGITCCQCNGLHTAPARLKLCCASCSHYACAACTTPFCCSCRKPWLPGDSPTIVLANRFRGGARSTKSSKKSSSSSSQSSGPGSLATAHSARNSPDPFIQASNPVLPTQSSADEIDAFVDAMIRASDVVTLRDEGARERSSRAPSPSSNLPPGSAPVFSRPPLPVITGATEDVPMAVPSRAPSRAESIVSASSIGDAGIANEPQPPPFPKPVDPPALNEVVGRIHRRFPLASLKVDNEDSRHFLARNNTQVDDIANETDFFFFFFA